MRKSLPVAAILLVCTLLLPGRRQASSPPPYQVPPDLGDGWQTASPKSVGLDRDKIEALVRQVRSGGYDTLHSVLLVKNGKLALEEYFHGTNRSSIDDVASVTKSITSLLIGIAIQQGAIAGTEQPLAELLPDYADLFEADPDKQDLKLWHVLTMTSGFEWDEETYPYGDPRNDCTQMERSADPVRFVLERPILHSPGTYFQYSGGNAMLLSAIIKRTTGMRPHLFAEQFLFEPLGISRTRWDLYANGLTDTGGGLSLQARDMAKIGLLALDNGRWNGKQVIPQAWIEESTRAQVAAGSGAQYGYLWWRTGIPVGLRRVSTYFASGFGGQQINVFPELGLVAVFTHELTPGSGNAMQNMALMSGYVLPAALPADVASALPWVWPVLLGLSLLGLVWVLARSGPWPLAVWWSWGWIALVFGPLAFLARRVSHGGAQRSGESRQALGAALYSASGNAAGFVLLFTLIALLQPQGDLLAWALIAPLLVGWLIFWAPMFAYGTGGGYFLALRRTLLTAIISTTLALAGMLPLIILLQVRWFPVGNFVLTNPLFWNMISVAALAGGLVLYPFNFWLARRGFLIWHSRIAAGAETGPAMPSLRSAWWALLLSVATLVASMGLTLAMLS
jgi:CubicO group peptidase (beta-lactamase class C family)